MESCKEQRKIFLRHSESRQSVGHDTEPSGNMNEQVPEFTKGPISLMLFSKSILVKS